MSDQSSFQEIVWGYYRDHGRHDLPWRIPDVAGSFDPYRILVSEMMLQQTQVTRVIPKYQAFLQTFPDVAGLAAAPLSTVLQLWSGLGYNRRAKFLWQAAALIMREHQGRVPEDERDLVTLPGVGPNTAAAIAVYAFNCPRAFIETNIRTVFMHHFLAGRSAVDDKILMPIIEDMMPQDNPREWYWALMDYGTYLKQTVGNVSRASKAYVKQSAFQGSRRQVRGQVLRALLAGPVAAKELARQIDDVRLTEVLGQLSSEGLIVAFDDMYILGA